VTAGTTHAKLNRCEQEVRSQSSVNSSIQIGATCVSSGLLATEVSCVAAIQAMNSAASYQRSKQLPASQPAQRAMLTQQDYRPQQGASDREPHGRYHGGLGRRQVAEHRIMGVGDQREGRHDGKVRRPLPCRLRRRGRSLNRNDRVRYWFLAAGPR
jgi:hypothetical protein